MKDYIDSYTAILPDIQRTRVIDELTKNLDKNQTFDKAQYEDLISSLATDRKILTEFVEMEDKLDSGIYNDFLSNSLADLTVLYNENDILERTINDYVRQNQSMIDEVKKYMDELRNKIAKLRYNDKTTSSSETYIESFKSFDNIVRKTKDNASDFNDRDGKELHECTVNTASGYTSLSQISVSDVILADKPSINLVKITGTPTMKNLFPMQNAIDRNMKTFWGNIVLADGNIDIPVAIASKENATTIYRDGLISVFDITFSMKERINNITLHFFEEYPTEVCAVLYKSIGSQEEDFKHLVTSAKTSQNQSATFNFQPTNVKVLRFVLRQKNSKKHLYTIFQEDEKNNQLIQSLLEADVEKSLTGNFTGLSSQEMNKMTGVEVFKNNYADFIKKFYAFKDLLNKEGYNWTDDKIKEYIKTGRY